MKPSQPIPVSTSVEIEKWITEASTMIEQGKRRLHFKVSFI